LGSLTYFFFSRASMTAAVMARLHPGHSHLKWNGTFVDVLPFLRQAFDEVLREFDTEVSTTLGPTIAPDVVKIVRELCEPDPKLRGYPGQLASSTTQFSMERYITRFDVLASRALVRGLK
jgi:hypothetical protein